MLLEGFAAVAPVPSRADFGIDAVATLLRDDGGVSVVAEDSFYVQLKADSVRSLDYRNAERDWLLSLELPFFVGFVGADGISLFATHGLSRASAERNKSDAFRLTIDDDAEIVTNDLRVIQLGPPAAKWTLKEVFDREAMRVIYRAMKSHISIDKRNIIHRLATRYETVEWSTNEPAKGGGIAITDNAASDERFPQLLSMVYPLLESLMFSLHLKGDLDGAAALAKLLQQMERYGHDSRAIVKALDMFFDFKRSQLGNEPWGSTTIAPAFERQNPPDK